MKGGSRLKGSSGRQDGQGEGKGVRRRREMRCCIQGSYAYKK